MEGDSRPGKTPGLATFLVAVGVVSVAGVIGPYLSHLSVWVIYITTSVVALGLATVTVIAGRRAVQPASAPSSTGTRRRLRLNGAQFGTLALCLIVLSWPAAAGLTRLTGWSFPGVDLALPLLICAIVGGRELLGDRPGWLRVGTFDAVSLILGVVTVAISAIALIAWSRLDAPTIAFQMKQLETIPRGWLVPAALGFAVSNAIVEEAIYRGVIREGLREFVPATAEVIVTSALFGLAHLHGFPSGAIGVGLVFVWGCALGVIRNRTGGMAGPIVVHIAADLTIAGILAFRLV
jgi:membrane protease YdiL (CAAX protease family)